MYAIRTAAYKGTPITICDCCCGDGVLWQVLTINLNNEITRSRQFLCQKCAERTDSLFYLDISKIMRTEEGDAKCST